jgi:hypothetical protein
MCNHPGGSIYRFGVSPGYIPLVRSTRFQEGKTMTQNNLIHVIWDFPVMLFNKGREKIRKLAAAREQEDARWLNG